MSFFDVSELGFWALAIPFVILAMNAAASVLLLPKRRRLIELAKRIIDDPRANDADRAWVAAAFESATDRLFPIFAACASPFLAIIFGFSLIKEVWDFRGESVDQFAARQEHETYRLHTETLRLITGRDPKSGVFWDADERKEIENIADLIGVARYPALMIWIGLWFLVGVAPALVAFLILTPANAVVDRTSSAVRATSLSLVDKLRIFVRA